MQTFIRPSSVVKAMAVSRAKLYKDIRAGLFPAPVSFSARHSAWPESEVNAIQQARIAGRTDAEIRALVQRLQAERLTQS